MARASPTQRSLAHLRKQGYTCAVVEKWNPHAHIRQDLFGCIDIVALSVIRLDQGTVGDILGIQATSATNLAARRTKSLAEPRLRTWLEAGGSFWLHAWSKKGARGKRKLWTLTEEEIALADLPALDHPAQCARGGDV